MRTVGDYYKQYCGGKAFTNNELVDALEKMGKLMDDLNSLGPEFTLAKREIARVYYGLDDFYFARNFILSFNEGGK
jgi:hypothetical protein